MSYSKALTLGVLDELPMRFLGLEYSARELYRYTPNDRHCRIAMKENGFVYHNEPSVGGPKILFPRTSCSVQRLPPYPALSAILYSYLLVPISGETSLFLDGTHQVVKWYEPSHSSSFEPRYRQSCILGVHGEYLSFRDRGTGLSASVQVVIHYPISSETSRVEGDPSPRDRPSFSYHRSMATPL